MPIYFSAPKQMHNLFLVSEKLSKSSQEVEIGCSVHLVLERQIIKHIHHIYTICVKYLPNHSIPPPANCEQLTVSQTAIQSLYLYLFSSILIMPDVPYMH